MDEEENELNYSIPQAKLKYSNFLSIIYLPTTESNTILLNIIP